MKLRSLLLLMLLPVMAQAAPQRIVSLNPCLDSILVEVAQPQQIRAISHFSHDAYSTSMPLQLARRFGKTYGTAEEILAQAPDLVLADIYAPASTRQALARLGVPVRQFDIPKNAEDSVAQIREIAWLVGQKARGEALVVRIQAALNVPQMKPTPALIRSNSGFVLGSGTVMDDLLRRSGFTNQSSQLGMKMSDILPLESLLLHPPALLFILTDDDSVHQQHPVMQRLSHRIETQALPQRFVNCAGPAMIDAMRFLVAARKAHK